MLKIPINHPLVLPPEITAFFKFDKGKASVHCGTFIFYINIYPVLWKEFQYSGITGEIPFVQCFSIG